MVGLQPTIDGCGLHRAAVAAGDLHPVLGCGALSGLNRGFRIPGGYAREGSLYPRLFCVVPSGLGGGGAADSRVSGGFLLVWGLIFAGFGLSKR